MASQVEKDRTTLLDQINNQGRRLERVSPDAALELNNQLSQVVKWLVKRGSQEAKSRGPKGK